MTDKSETTREIRWDRCPGGYTVTITDDAAEYERQQTLAGLYAQWMGNIPPQEWASNGLNVCPTCGRPHDLYDNHNQLGGLFGGLL